MRITGTSLRKNDEWWERITGKAKDKRKIIGEGDGKKDKRVKEKGRG